MIQSSSQFFLLDESKSHQASVIRMAKAINDNIFSMIYSFMSTMLHILRDNWSLCNRSFGFFSVNLNNCCNSVVLALGFGCQSLLARSADTYISFLNLLPQLKKFLGLRPYNQCNESTHSMIFDSCFGNQVAIKNKLI